MDKQGFETLMDSIKDMAGMFQAAKNQFVELGWDERSAEKAAIVMMQLVTAQI